MTSPKVEDFQSVVEALGKVAKSHKRQIFSLLWVVDSTNLILASAANGELKVTMRVKKPGNDLYEYHFKDYGEFLSSFARLEFLLEQALNILLTDLPTAEGFIRSGLIVQRLDFTTKMNFIKDFQPGSLEGIGETLKKLQEMRNIFAHNPNPVGSYNGHSIDTDTAKKAIEQDYSKCFNTLVELYRQHQYKLLNFLEINANG